MSHPAFADDLLRQPRQRQRTGSGGSGLDRAIIAAARRSGWVLHARELAAVGCAPDATLLRVRRGLLTPLFHGVYLVGRDVPTAEERLRAALLTGRGCLLAGRAAASHHGWLELRPGDPVVLASPTARRAQPGLVVRQRSIAEHEWTIRRGLPTTTVAATLGELAKTHTVSELTRFIHEAELRKQLAVDGVLRWLVEHPRAHGARRLRRALQRHRPLVGSVGSGLEQRFHRFLAWAGLPPTEHNVRFELAAGTGRRRCAVSRRLACRRGGRRPSSFVARVRA